MQQINNPSCGLFTIAYATNIAFGLDHEEFIYNAAQMQLHLLINITIKIYLHFPNIHHNNKIVDCH
jgi:hypothetical protein